MSGKFVNEILYPLTRYEVRGETSLAIQPPKPTAKLRKFCLRPPRLASQYNTLNIAPTSLKQYHHIINEQLANGQTERCDDTLSSDDTGKKVHYLPHRGVTWDNAEQQNSGSYTILLQKL